jgi:hypothetical protein
MPDCSRPLSGACQPLGSLPSPTLAPELWRQHRETLSYLVLLESPEVEGFLIALSEYGSALFLLITGPTGAALWSCSAGQEKAARQFAAAVCQHANPAAAA